MSLRFFQRLVGMGRRDQQDQRDQQGPRDGPALARSEARIPDGLRVYAVGDVHGRVDLFDRMAGLIAQDLADCPLIPAASTGLALQSPGPAGAIEPPSGQAMPAGGVVTVFLGDYIDRGPSSMEVIDRLAGGKWPTPIIALIGNHELMCLQFLQDAETLWRWRDVGALSTLASYGVDVSPLMAANRNVDAAEGVRIAFVEAMPQAHYDFMTTSLEPCTGVGDYFFCHAGVRPGIPLQDQDILDLMTIRDAFLGSEADFGKVVVHGHTPQETPTFRRNRIGIDTGAYATGCLTCLVLEGANVRILDTK